ncbi:MAG: hypothetical protein Q4C53_08410, partial [Clostridia bacterium]|nr:hypothetical protein [Clostridia bacterium]
TEEASLRMPLLLFHNICSEDIAGKTPQFPVARFSSLLFPGKHLPQMSLHRPPRDARYHDFHTRVTVGSASPSGPFFDHPSTRPGRVAPSFLRFLSFRTHTLVFERSDRITDRSTVPA